MFNLTIDEVDSVLSQMRIDRAVQMASEQKNTQEFELGVNKWAMLVARKADFHQLIYPPTFSSLLRRIVFKKMCKAIGWNEVRLDSISKCFYGVGVKNRKDIWFSTGKGCLTSYFLFAFYSKPVVELAWQLRIDIWKRKSYRSFGEFFAGVEVDVSWGLYKESIENAAIRVIAARTL